MKLLVNTETMEQTVSGSITGGLYYSFDDQYFPAKEWSDFPVVILGWWLGSLIELLGGACEGEFDFMDGPYQVDIKSQSNGLYLVKCINERNTDEILFSGKYTLSEVVDQVINVAKKVYDHCLKNHWINDDVESLQINLLEISKRVVVFRRDQLKICD